MEKGIEPRHRKGCPAHNGGRCKCNPGIRPSVWDREAGKLLRPPAALAKQFSDHRPFDVRLREARRWRHDAEEALAAGTLSAVRHDGTLAALWEEFVSLAEKGGVLTSKEKRYGPSTLSRMRLAMGPLMAEDKWGALRPDQLTSGLVRKHLRERLSNGKAPGTVRNELGALRALYRWAQEDHNVHDNPVDAVKLPAARTGRPRQFCTTEQAQALLASLEEPDRVLWGIAFYSGLRRSEILGLCWDAIDLERGLLTVRRTYLYEEKLWREEAKTDDSDLRRVPIMPQLRAILELARARSTGAVTVSILGPDGKPREIEVEPVMCDALASNSWASIQKRADRAWKTAGLDRIVFHSCRHTFVSWLIAAAARAGETDVKALMRVTGHSTYQMFFDTYGHLLPDSVDRLGDALTAFAAAG